MNQEAAELAVKDLLRAIGYDPNIEALHETPSRVARAWGELLSGRHEEASQVLKASFDSDGFDQLILLRNVPFYSMCEHHLLPFYGTASVGYIPRQGDRVVGLSKLARLVEMHARRLQLQERMTRDIANDINKHLNPLGVGVAVRASHLCMCARGVEKPGSEMFTSMLLGVFRTDASARSEFLSLLR